MTIHKHEHLHHTIHDMTSHMHYGWDRDRKPILEIEPGQSVGFEIIECSGGQLSKNSKAEALSNFDFDKLNPVSGPFMLKVLSLVTRWKSISLIFVH